MIKFGKYISKEGASDIEEEKIITILPRKENKIATFITYTYMWMPAIHRGLFSIRMFLSVVLRYLLKKLGNLNLDLTRIDPDEAYIYFRTEKLKISKFKYILKNKEIDKNKNKQNYKTWQNFINDIKTNGIRNNPMVVRNNLKSDYIFDGFHRTKAYEVLYGPDCEMLYDIYVPYDFLKYEDKRKDIVKGYADKRAEELKNKTL
tara:strand:+ start:402 stop:1013 length:612 start_codon:yes stop_codon:yes gene_type:complete